MVKGGRDHEDGNVDIKADDGEADGGDDDDDDDDDDDHDDFAAAAASAKENHPERGPLPSILN